MNQDGEGLGRESGDLHSLGGEAFDQLLFLFPGGLAGAMVTVMTGIVILLCTLMGGRNPDDCARYEKSSALLKK